jgi:hypothetical protein
MTTSGTTRPLALLVMSARLLAAVVALGLLAYAVRGDILPIAQLASVPHSIGAVVTTSADTEPAPSNPVGRGQLRRQFQELFAHHATLATRFMRSTVSEDPGFVEAANAVLVRNTNDLRAALTNVVHPDDAEAVARGWQTQSQALFGYAAALRDGDGAARRDAGSALGDHVQDQAALLVTATNGRLDRNEVSASLQMQVDLLRYQIDAYARGNYGQAYKLERETYTQTDPLAADLASAAAHRAPGSAGSRPREELNSQLSSLLGLHAELAVDAMRAGVAGDSKEFRAATGALVANSGQLATVFDSTTGTRSSRRLSELWTTQTDLLLRYAAAVADEDLPTRRELRKRLRAAGVRYGRVLASVSPDGGDAAAASDALRSLQMTLVEQVEAYARGDHATAHDVAYAAHHRAHGLARVLAEILVTGLPKGGAQTGGGGTVGGA